MPNIVPGAPAGSQAGHPYEMPDPQPAVPPPPAPRDPSRYRICVVCLGNICRSPMAEVLLQDRIAAAGLAGLVTVESAGTGDWHIGGPMAQGSEIELGRHGLDGSRHQARQITPAWLDQFDLLLAMDRGNMRSLLRMAAARRLPADRIRMFRSFDAAAPDEAEVPDPYGCPQPEYAKAFDIIEPAADGLVAALTTMLAGRPAG